MTIATDYSATLAGLDRPRPPEFTVGPADGADIAAYRRLRRIAFVEQQRLFDGGSDADDVDEDPRAIVLVARDRDGAVIGGVRLAPATVPDLGWWEGSRLVVRPTVRRGSAGGVGAALVRAACAHAEAAGALRFEASVQLPVVRFFTRLGWSEVGECTIGGLPHRRMRWPIRRVQALVDATKTSLGPLLAGLRPGGAGFVGDDGAPVPGSDLVAACDAIVPAMVERDPEWAGWCGVLVNVNDLAAMGATGVGLLDAVGAADAGAAARVLSGLRAAADAYGVPILGGHTQLGVPAALTVTALGRTDDPVPAAGGRPGDHVTLIADLAGGWRPGYAGRQWDSTTSRRAPELHTMVTTLTRHRPAAAKDVSMAGVLGTLGMLAEASGCGAELDVAALPRPAGASVGDWLTCFPGFALLTADRPSRAAPAAGPAEAARCGRLTAGDEVSLCWPDGVRTPAVAGPVTGLGPG
ncbi:MAG TPA: MSMEG_0567/sll0787 family protein [Mycobacteriales bacterium]|jgi:putative N-acetyltransferase (TIGR04045 family)|nr:MSMEG_0567/sll0787 family protein [Mycobacteriales bacterium]